MRKKGGDVAMQNAQQAQTPGYQQGYQQGYQPGYQPGYQQGYQPGYQPGYQQGYQPGFIGTAINDFNSNKEALKPMYDTAATIGIIYNVFFTFIIIIICSFMIYMGFWLKNINSNKSERVSGKYTNVKCTTQVIEDTNKNKNNVINCSTDVVYNVNGKEYKKTHQVGYAINDNQSVTVNYDPANPDDFSTDNNYYYFGIGLIVVGILAIIIALFWSILSIMYKPIAAASGVGAIGDALM
jgi:hypothetical protein